MAGFDSSDDESDMPVDTTPLKIDWLDLTEYGCTADLGISALPGCRFKDTWRSLKYDIGSLKSEDVKDVFVLCSKGELNKYRVSSLLEEYKEAEFVIHHHPFPDGQTPPVPDMVKILDELKVNLMQGRKSLVHCYGGLGRSSLVVSCLLMMLSEELEPDGVQEKVKSLRGSNAIQSIKQYNFINDFRGSISDLETKEKTSRSVSR